MKKILLFITMLGFLINPAFSQKKKHSGHYKHHPGKKYHAHKHHYKHKSPRRPVRLALPAHHPPLPPLPPLPPPPPRP